MSSKSLIMETDMKYSLIVNELLKYICEMRKREKNMSLFDITYDFCFKNNYDCEEVGDAIRNDVYLSDLILDECKLLRTVKIDGKIPKVSEDW